MIMYALAVVHLIHDLKSNVLEVDQVDGLLMVPLVLALEGFW